ncbi:integrase [Streptomyces sp. NPDC050698]
MANSDLSITVSTTARQVDADVRPGRFDAATEARLSRFDHEATAYVEKNRPERTRTGYAADWNAWFRLCAERDLPPSAVRTGTLVAFVEWCWHQPARPPKPWPGARYAHRALHYRSPPVRCGRHRPPPAQAAAGRGPRRAGPRPAQGEGQGDGEAGERRGRGPAPALLVRHMEKIAATLPRNRFGTRDLSLVTLHFALAGREQELAYLRLRNIAEDPEGRGLIVDVRVSKVAPRTVEVPFGSRAHLCPVRAWRRWRIEPARTPTSTASRSARCTTDGRPSWTADSTL